MKIALWNIIYPQWVFAATTIFMFAAIQYPSTDQLNLEDASGLPGGEHFTWKASSIPLQKLVRNESMETLSWVNFLPYGNCFCTGGSLTLQHPIVSNLLEPSNHFITHFSFSRDLLCCSALARAMAPVSVRSLSLRLQWYNQIQSERLHYSTSNKFWCHGYQNNN